MTAWRAKPTWTIHQGCIRKRALRRSVFSAPETLLFCDGTRFALQMKSTEHLWQDEQKFSPVTQDHAQNWCSSIVWSVFVINGTMSLSFWSRKSEDLRKLSHCQCSGPLVCWWRQRIALVRCINPEYTEPLETFHTHCGHTQSPPGPKALSLPHTEDLKQVSDFVARRACYRALRDVRGASGFQWFRGWAFRFFASLQLYRVWWFQKKWKCSGRICSPQITADSCSLLDPLQKSLWCGLVLKRTRSYIIPINPYTSQNKKGSRRVLWPAPQASWQSYSLKKLFSFPPHPL